VVVWLRCQTRDPSIMDSIPAAGHLACGLRQVILLRLPRPFARPKFLLATLPKIWNFLKET
jgi:hypothetical protein